MYACAALNHSADMRILKGSWSTEDTLANRSGRYEMSPLSFRLSMSTHDVHSAPMKESGSPFTIQSWRGEARGGAGTHFSPGNNDSICSVLRTRRARWRGALQCPRGGMCAYGGQRVAGLGVGSTCATITCVEGCIVGWVGGILITLLSA